MSSSSGNILPPEVTETILHRLPVKSLGRFKSVSKSWYSLISNPQFVKTHLHLNHHKSRKSILVICGHSLYSIDVSELLINTDDDEISATGTEIIFPGPPITWQLIWGSCNGLVLAEDKNYTLFVINPTTKEIWKVLPSPFGVTPEGRVCAVLGFGYDSSTDDYKVVSIPHDVGSSGDEHSLSVYSLRNNSWRKLPNCYPVFGQLLDCVLVNNENLNWFTEVGERCTILAFSLANEVFSEIKLPDSIVNNYDMAVVSVMFAVGAGKLGLFDAYYDSWVMEDYGVADSWTKLCIDGLETGGYKHSFFFVEGINDGDFIVLQDEDRVFVYSMDEKRCRQVKIEGGPTGSSVAFVKATYFESLESPNLMHPSGLRGR